MEAWGCLASPFLSLPHSLKYRILALPMPGGCLSTLPRPEQAVFISVCPLHQLPDHSSCSSGYPLPPPAPPSTAPRGHFPGPTCSCLRLEPCSIFPRTLVRLFTRPGLHSPLHSPFGPFSASLPQLITQGFSLFPKIHPHFQARGSSY